MGAILKRLKEILSIYELDRNFAPKNMNVHKVLLKSIQTIGRYHGHTHTLAYSLLRSLNQQGK